MVFCKFTYVFRTTPNISSFAARLEDCPKAPSTLNWRYCDDLIAGSCKGVYTGGARSKILHQCLYPIELSGRKELSSEPALEPLLPTENTVDREAPRQRRARGSALEARY